MPVGALLRRFNGSGSLLALVLALLMLAGPADAADAFPVSVPGISDSIIMLPDGSLLFNDNFHGTLSRLDPQTGDIVQIELPVAQIRNQTLGADARIWFTIDSARQIGRYSPPTGLLDLFPMPDNISGSIGQMALNIDGSLWATATDSNRILRISPTGVMTTFDIQSYDPQPVGIAQGPDGNMWFTERGAKKIGRITPAGTITEFAVQYPMLTGPSPITRGSDDAMWFATDDGFGRIALNGEITLFVTGPQPALGRLVQGSDGAFWLTTGDGFVTRFVPPGNVSRIFLWEQPAHSAGLIFDRQGVLYIVDAQLRQFSRLARILDASAGAGDAHVVEFYNSTLKHYFITPSAEEAAGIDAGTAGPGWSRTGETWPAWVNGPPPGAKRVCRFYGNPALSPTTGKRLGPNSHFYTFEGPECEQVKADPGWLFEALNPFYQVEPVDGHCAPGLAPVYRAYNNGFAANDSNHRYAVKQSLYDQMLAQGWKGEGIVMCAAPSR
jgi:streptogramin lyase